MTSDLTRIKEHRCFDGVVCYCEHLSHETSTKMKFSYFMPAGQINGCVIWLSGLTCTEENFMVKAAAFQALAKHGLMVACPDTSPRGLSLPGESESWDFGVGAGFYVNATTPGYKDHYRMYSYVSEEFYELLTENFGVENKISIMGHSMGGHGALVMGLRQPEKFCSISAFAPICNPTQVPWGKKAMRGYLGDDQTEWKKYDACELLVAGSKHPREILIEQGLTDIYLESQLHPDAFVSAAKTSGQTYDYRKRPGYDHSYYFISTFIADHVDFHAQAINGN
jgi:S-formylglutathione hydrolase